MSAYVNATELLPGEPVQVFPRRLPRLPPDNFIDRNDYCFKLVSGQMRLRGIELRPGWENWPVTPGKLSCYHKKGEGKVGYRNLDWTVLMPKMLELKAEGKSDLEISKQLDIAVSTVKRKFKEASTEEKQTQPPEPDQAANQEPERETAEPAEDSIPEDEFTDEAYKCEVCGKFITPEEGITTLEGLWVCDKDSCRFLDKDNNACAFIMPEYDLPVGEKKPFNLDTFKIRVLEIFQEVARANQAPAYVSLAFIDAIISVCPEVD